jgi:Fe-S cluster assembly iron-binding protein IscA
MTDLLVDDAAIEIIKKELKKDDVFAMRIFIGGGGCCKHFEMIPVKKALTGDVTFIRGGLNILVEKELAQNSSKIEIKNDEHKGLLIELT